MLFQGHNFIFPSNRGFDSPTLPESKDEVDGFASGVLHP